MSDGRAMKEMSGMARRRLRNCENAELSERE